MLRRFVRSLSFFVHAEDGPTAVEYAILLSLLVIACVGMITALGSRISNTFDSTSSSLESTGSGGSSDSGYSGVIGSGSANNGSWSTNVPGYAGLSMSIEGSSFSFQLNGNMVTGTITQTGANTYSMTADGYTGTMTVNGNTATISDPNTGQTITFTKNN